MIIYPLIITPYEGDAGGGIVGNFLGFFPDLKYGYLGFERDDVIGLAPQKLCEALTELFDAGQPMPLESPVEVGQLGVVAPFLWRMA